MPYSANIRLLFSFFFLHLYPPPSLLQNPHPSILSLTHRIAQTTLPQRHLLSSSSLIHPSLILPYLILFIPNTAQQERFHLLPLPSRFTLPIVIVIVARKLIVD